MLQKTKFPETKEKGNIQEMEFSPKLLFVLAASDILSMLENRCPGKSGWGTGDPSYPRDRRGAEWKFRISFVISLLRLMRPMLSKSGFWLGDTCFCMLIDFWGKIKLGDVTAGV